MSDNENAVSEETSTEETWIINENPDISVETFMKTDITGKLNPLTANNTYGDPVKMYMIGVQQGQAFAVGINAQGYGGIIYGLPLDSSDTSGEKTWKFVTENMEIYTVEDTTKLRTITFDTAPTGDLLTWLEANAVKRLEGDLSTEDKKKAVNLQDLVYVRQYIDKKMKSETDKLNNYYTKEEIQEEYYDKTEMQESYYDKTSSEETFYKKTDTVANATNAENATNAVNATNAENANKAITADKVGMLDINLSGNNNAYNVIDISETGGKDNLNLSSGLYHLMIVSGEQTWKFNDTVNTNVTENKVFENGFTSNNENFIRITVTTDGRLVYGQSDGSGITVYSADNSPDHWVDHNIDNTKYKVVKFTTPPTGDLLDYLEENATLYFEDGNYGDYLSEIKFSGLVAIPKYGVGFTLSFNEVDYEISSDGDSAPTSTICAKNCFLRYTKEENNGTIMIGSVGESGQIALELLTNHKILYRKISD